MSDFKTNFDESLQRLAQINTAIDENIASKQAFSRQVINRLGDINQRIRSLADLIRGLKSQLEGLQGQVDSNNSGIQERNSELERLRSQVEQLTSERDAAQTELEQLRQQYDAERQQMQATIQDLQGQITTLTAQNAQAEAQRAALQQELEASGNQKDQAHAAAIQDLNNQHTGAIEQMRGQHQTDIDTLNAAHQEELRQQIERLTAEIDSRQQQIDTLTQTTADAVTQHNAEKSNLEQQMQELQARIGEIDVINQNNTLTITQLQTDLQNLQVENDDLKRRIIAATEEIMTATNRLQELNRPDDFNQGELDAKFDEVIESIQAISNAIQGHPGNPPSNASVQVQSPAPARQQKQLKMPENSIIIIDGWQKPLSQIVNDLKSKIQKDSRPNNKYALALQQLYEATDEEDVRNILSINNILYTRKSGDMKGGKTKKKRKYKKQRGGFTYRPNAKRKSLATSLFSKTRSSRTRSSRRSSRKSSRK